MKKIYFALFYFLTTMPSAALAHVGDENYGNMMDWHFGNGTIMGSTGVFAILFLLTWLVWLAVGILVAIWLWRIINKK